MVWTRRDGWKLPIRSARAACLSVLTAEVLVIEAYSLEDGKMLGLMPTGVQDAGRQVLVGALPTPGTTLLVMGE